MGSFGIFFLCLTFFYLLYYAVMILMDIYGKKARQTDGVEEFKVGGGAGTVENPDQVLDREHFIVRRDFVYRRLRKLSIRIF